VLEQGLSGAITGMAYVATAGASSSIAANGHIAALTMLNLAMTYVFSAGWSVAGAAAGLEKGRSNNRASTIYRPPPHLSLALLCSAQR